VKGRGIRDLGLVELVDGACLARWLKARAMIAADVFRDMYLCCGASRQGRYG
jgi:hypothetical protein